MMICRLAVATMMIGCSAVAEYPVDRETVNTDPFAVTATGFCLVATKDQDIPLAIKTLKKSDMTQPAIAAAAP